MRIRQNWTGQDRTEYNTEQDKTSDNSGLVVRQDIRQDRTYQDRTKLNRTYIKYKERMWKTQGKVTK